MSANRPNLSQLFAGSGIYCDKFEGRESLRPNLSQLFAGPGIYCDEFEGGGVR